MLEFSFHPDVYSTSSNNSLLKMLESMWLKEHELGDGNFYIISGYSNYNGGLRFYTSFANHVAKGGTITAIISGSLTQRLSSVQVIEELLKCGVNVYIVNRKHLLHAKCYGVSNKSKEELIITSGNFTGPGMSLNGEAALRVDNNNLKSMSFLWSDLINNILKQNWDIYNLNIDDLTAKSNPGWKFLYDESKPVSLQDESEQVSMVIVLNQSDTLKIQAFPGSNQGLGSQYFRLGNNAFDFFPALSEVNTEHENSYYCNITINFMDIGIRKVCKVSCIQDTFLEFFLGTDILRFSKIADEQDLALITRTDLYNYELRIIKRNSLFYKSFLNHADNFNESSDKQYGYLSNYEVKRILRGL